MANDIPNLRQLQELKERIQELRVEESKAQGVLEREKAVLKDEYGCSSLKGGRALYKKLMRRAGKERDKFLTMLEQYEELRRQVDKERDKALAMLGMGRSGLDDD